MTLAYVDLDDFKRVNDRFGHSSGDEALRFIADIFRRHLRITDLCARVGGDEFILLLPQTDAVTAKEVLERLKGDLGVAVERDSPTSTGIRNLAERNLFAKGAKRVFVVARDKEALFGMLRMLEIYLDRHPVQIRVQYERIGDARRWLGLSSV